MVHLGVRALRVLLPQMTFGALGLALVAAGAQPAGAQAGTVAGTVLDTKSGRPLADAIVVVEGTQSGARTGVRGDFLKGVTAERLVVLDLARILADPKIIVHEEVEA